MHSALLTVGPPYINIIIKFENKLKHVLHFDRPLNLISSQGSNFLEEGGLLAQS